MPSSFKCPITLNIMQDPVVTCDGAGYYIFIKNLSKIAVGLSPLPQILVSYYIRIKN